jgi:hypothetical protein
MPVRMSIRQGLTPSMNTRSGVASSAGVEIRPPKPNRSSARSTRSAFSTDGSTNTSMSSVRSASTWKARAWAPIRRNFVFSERSPLKNSRQSWWMVVIAEVQAAQLLHRFEPLRRGRRCGVVEIGLIGLGERSDANDALNLPHLVILPPKT